MNRNQFSDAELRLQRERIQRGLLRANAAAVGILFIVITLAAAAMVAALRAERNALAAVVASQQTQEQRFRAETELWKSRLAEARALRLSGEEGRRSRALDALREAARLQPSLELRNEAVASLALIDLQPDGLIHPLPPESSSYAFDDALEHFALSQTNGEITVHRSSDGVELARLSSPTGRNPVIPDAWRIEFRPGGKELAALYMNGAVVLWDLARSNHFTTLSSSGRVSRDFQSPLGFSPDGGWISILRPGNAGRIRNLETGSNIDFTMPDLRSIAFHPETNWLALAGGRQVRLVEWPGGKTIRILTNSGVVNRAIFRPDGRQLAIASAETGLSLWTLESDERMELQLQPGGFNELNYSADGHYVSAALGEGVSSIWDSRTGRLLHKFSGARVSRFGKVNDMIAYERLREGIGLCRLSGPEVLRWFYHTSDRDGQRRLWSVDFSDDLRWLAGADNRHFIVWDLSTGAEIAALETVWRRLTVSWLPRRQAWLTTGLGGISIWPMATNSQTGVVRPGKPKEIPLQVSSALGQSAVDRMEQRVALVTQPNTVLLVDLDRAEVTSKLEGPPAIGHLAFSPDATSLASSSTGGDGVLVWSLPGGDLVRHISGPHGRVAWSADGRHLGLGSDREYQFWETSGWNREEGRRLRRENFSGTTGALAFSEDGQFLAVARERNLVQLLDAASGRPLAALAAPEAQGISWLRFSRDGQKLAVATFEGAIQVWDFPSLRRRLADLALDWGRATGPSHLGTLIPGPRPGSMMPSGMIILPLLGVVLALGAALFAFRRQRSLLQGYMQLDALAARRTEELELAQKEILHSQKMKALGTLAAGIAHDFNNLLSIIRMANKLTGREAKDNSEIQENVMTVEHAVEQGKGVVRSMLGYSRAPLESTCSYSVVSVVEDSVALLSKEFLRGIELTLELDRDAPLVVGAPDRLEQILLNLIVNASEAMGGRGELHIAVKTRSDAHFDCVLRPKPARSYVELMVADSGAGIDPAILPRIFEPFFTTKTSGAARGTGLGLSMIYTIAEHDGLGIAVAAAPGGGAIFQILIPVETSATPAVA